MPPKAALLAAYSVPPAPGILSATMLPIMMIRPPLVIREAAFFAARNGARTLSVKVSFEPETRVVAVDSLKFLKLLRPGVKDSKKYQHILGSEIGRAHV